MKKTYIPSTPRSRKLKSIGGGTINVSGGSAQNVPVIEGHTHDNKIILDAITQLHLRILSSLNVDDDGALIVELSNIIKELDATVPTDENLFSALRTVLEIRARSISKTDPDTAQEIIKFVKGIEIGTFTTGPLGAGASLKMENGVSRMEVDQLDVRMRATFRELIIESLKHIGGQLILSPARMKCNKVVDGGTYYKCYFDTGDGKVSNEFVAGDQARCQVFTGSGVKMYWRLVTSVGTDWINLSKTDAISGSSIPEAGDDIVQLGHRTDTTRQNAQILSTVGVDAPSWKQYKGINAFSLEGKDTTVFSGTGNKIDGKTVFMSSGANVEDGINSKNSNYSSQPTSYKANDTWTLSADQTVNGIAYKSGEILTATQDSTTYNQAHWIKKVRYTDDTAVENLQIGGVNLINGDTKLIERTGIGWTHIPLSRQLVEGKTYILGGEFRIDTGTLGVIGLNNADSNIGLVVPPRNTPFVATAYMASRTHFALAKQVGTSDLIVSAKEVKLEEGNKKTAWAQSPEYVQTKIDAAKQEALTAAGNAQTSANTANTAVGNLNTYVDGSFKDGVIEASEAKAIEKYINVVNTEKSNLEATYNTLYANTYLEGTPKTNLLNAKVTYFGAVDTLLNSINTAISDGKTTIAEKQAVDTNYTSYKTALASLQTAIENANKAIQSKLDSISKGYVDELAAGGANLVQTLSAWTLGTGWQLISDTLVNTTSSTFNHCQSPNFNLVAGKRYILTAFVEDIVGNGVIQIHTGTTARLHVAAKKGNISVEFTAIATEAANIRVYGNTTTIYKIKNIVVRAIGVQERIDISKLTAEQAQLAADGYMRARYVRDWVNGNTVNWNNQWCEVKAFNKIGTNVALGKVPEGNGTFHASNPASNITDGNINNQGYIPNSVQTLNYIKIDLGQVYYDIDYIQIWHYYLDGRTYYNTKTEISTDGVNWTPVFDSAKSGTYKETAAGNIISFRPNEVLAKVLKGAAVTDTFKTTINGGLISTVMILLRELSSIIETAGISGIQDDGYLPAYWSGGTYAEALAFGELMRAVDRGDNPIASATLNAKMSSIVMLHNGHAKVGELIVKSNGQIIVLDKATGKIKFIINSQDIPSVAELMGGTAFGETKNNSSVLGISVDTTLSETISVTKNNSNITFTATSLSLSAVLDDSRCTVSLKLYKDGAYYNDIANVTISGSGAMSDSLSNISRTFTGCPIGTYSVRIMFSQSGLVLDKSASLSASVLKWDFTQSGVRYFQLGLNGLMAFYSDNHFHYTETGGLDLRGATNMPGAMAKGRVLSGAARDANYAWGAKYSTAGVTKISTGGYRVPVSCPDAYYSVLISPRAASRSYYLGTQTSTYFEVYFTNLSGAAVDTEFDFTVVGKNY